MKMKKPEVQEITQKWLDYMQARSYMKEKYPEVWTNDADRALWHEICDRFNVVNGHDIDEDQFSWLLEDYMGWDDESDEDDESSKPDDYDQLSPLLKLLFDEFGNAETYEFPGLIISW